MSYYVLRGSSYLYVRTRRTPLLGVTSFRTVAIEVSSVKGVRIGETIDFSPSIYGAWTRDGS